jgi:hypothetical protein
MAMNASPLTLAMQEIKQTKKHDKKFTNQYSQIHSQQQTFPGIN